MGDFSNYPDVKQNKLKEIYLKIILSLNPPSDFKKGKALSLTAENVLFTVGSMEGLDLLLRTFCEPYRDIICVTSPSFPAYEHWALIHSLCVKSVPLLGDQLDHFSIEEILQINPKMIFICDPNNPTGTKLRPEIIQKLCEFLEGFVIVDEAYIEFSHECSSVFLLKKYKNLIILRTFSKAWGLAGARCGAIIADKSIINALRYIQLPFALSSPAQLKVEERLLHPEETFASWERIKKNREELIENLSQIKGVKIFKSDANFIMLVVENFHKIMEALKEHKIHVLDCSPSFSNSMRVSLGTPDQNRKFLEVIQQASIS